MTQDRYGNWHRSDNLWDDWREVDEMRRKEVAEGNNPVIAATMAMVLLDNFIMKNIAKTKESKKNLSDFEGDFKGDIYLKVVDLLGKNSEGEWKFIFVDGEKYSFATRMAKEIFGIRREQMQGGKGTPSKYQRDHYNTETISVEAYQDSMDKKNQSGDNGKSFELRDENCNIADEFEETLYNEAVDFMKKVCPIVPKPGDPINKNALKEAGCFARFLGGFQNMSPTMRKSIIDTAKKKEMSNNTNQEEIEK